jgi:hypothetical protein
MVRSRKTRVGPVRLSGTGDATLGQERLAWLGFARRGLFGFGWRGSYLAWLDRQRLSSRDPAGQRAVRPARYRLELQGRLVSAWSGAAGSARCFGIGLAGHVSERLAR